MIKYFNFLILVLIPASILCFSNIYTFKTGFILTTFLTYYKEAQNREINIQNIFNGGIPVNLIYYSNTFYFFNLNQVYFYNINKKEDKEILYRNNTDYQSKIFIYHKNNTHGGIYYQYLFLIIGYTNPYESLWEIQQDPFYYHIFPGIDFRIDLKNHIFTLSPLFLYDKEQLFYKNDEDINFIVNHYIQKEFDKLNNNHNQNYKIHYAFFSKYLSFYSGHYYINQKNLYSNTKNQLELNFYDYFLLIKLKYLILKGQISKSIGNFYNGKSYYNINGYKYNISLLIRFNNFYFLLEGSKTTKSKWNNITNKWEYFGYTSIFDEFLLTPQFSATYSLNSHYEICYNTQNSCEGIFYLDNDNHFKQPSDTIYFKIKYFYSFIELIFSTGYIEKTILKQNSFLFENIYLEKNESKTYYLEPVFQIIIKHNNFKFIGGYSEFYKKSEKKYKYISKNYQLSFIYYI
ncbi:MAG: hypothetical protein KatS3mg129_1798 [Leptospiraceae bacterium]|nr:MAG: hypothetical protein KatS3mg129_1798 [Leptospiraceae bacterium]